MSYIKPKNRGQFMIPMSLDAYVSDDNIVRFIDIFVDKILSNSNISYGKGKSDTGRSAYSFNVLLKIYIYGYLNSISSTRKLENECCRNMEMIWLTGNLHPAHKTIADFRKDNKQEIREFTLRFRHFLRDEKYLSGKTIVSDGTKIKAYASRNTISLDVINQRLERIEAELDKYLNQLNESDLSEAFDEHLTNLSDELGVETALLEKIAELQNQVSQLEQYKKIMEQGDRQHLAPADPDAKIMKTKEGFMPAYNAQSTVDTKNHMIAQLDATEHPNDFYDLEENLKAVQTQLNITPEKMLADAGFANEEQIKSLEEQNIKCIVPFAENYQEAKDRENGISFKYNEKEDVYTCNKGQKLILTEKNRKYTNRKNNYLYNKYQCRTCANCPLKSKCTQSKTGRIINRRVDDSWLKAYKEKLKTPEYRQGVKDRKKYVEHPFGTIKYWMGQIPLLLRGKEKVQVELDLYSTCYNLKRLLNIENRQLALQKVQNWG